MEIEEICLPCATGYHWECWKPLDTGYCHCTADGPVVFEAEPTGDTEKKERGGQIKEQAAVTDTESTGRKRAAKMYPIPKEGEPGYPMKCEWAGLKAAGGGVEPIVGCVGNMAKNIHHGPNKNTLENSVGNVHRICPQCHNRWHTLNDPYYAPNRPAGNVPYLPIEVEGVECKPHDGITPATAEDIASHEMMWINRKLKKVED